MVPHQRIDAAQLSHGSKNNRCWLQPLSRSIFSAVGRAAIKSLKLLYIFYLIRRHDHDSRVLIDYFFGLLSAEEVGAAVVTGTWDAFCVLLSVFAVPTAAVEAVVVAAATMIGGVMLAAPPDT
jgi:hypothetical protein